MKTLLALLAVCFTLISVSCVTPKHSTQKLAAAPELTKSQYESLPERFDQLSCSLVRIDSDSGSGTGFFIDDQGTIATAAHVVVSAQFSIQGNLINVSLVPQKNLRATTSWRLTRPLQISQTPMDAQLASTDLAVIKTNFTPRCHIELGESKTVRVGTHLIALGFPGYDAPHAVLYDGFLSSRHPHAPFKCR